MIICNTFNFLKLTKGSGCRSINLLTKTNFKFRNFIQNYPTCSVAISRLSSKFRLRNRTASSLKPRLGWIILKSTLNSINKLKEQHWTIFCVSLSNRSKPKFIISSILKVTGVLLIRAQPYISTDTMASRIPILILWIIFIWFQIWKTLMIRL